MNIIVKQYLEEFEENVIKQHEYTLVGDWKTGNKAAKKIHRAFKKIKEKHGIDQLFLLTKSNKSEVKLMAAVYCLPAFTSECLAICEEIQREDNSILSLGAGQTIKNWNNGDYHLWDE